MAKKIDRRKIQEKDKLTGDECAQKLKDAGIHWNTNAELARKIGLKSPGNISTILRHGGNKRLIKKWIKHAETSHSVHGIYDSLPTTGNNLRFTGQQIREKLSHAGFQWNSPTDLAQQLGESAEFIDDVLQNGMDCTEYDKWEVEIMVSKITNKVSRFDTFVSNIQRAMQLRMESDAIIKGLLKHEQKLICKWAKMLQNDI